MGGFGRSLKMKRTWKILRGFLLIWGAITFLAFLIVVGIILYQYGSNNPSNKVADNQDVRFVLNWCELGDDRITEVTHSYTSSRSLTGDHLDGHAIRISHVEESELTSDESGRGWYRGDQLEGITEQAVDYAEMWLHRDEMSWFPSSEQLRSKNMYAYLWSLDISGVRPDATQIIFVNPKSNMIYYFDASH